MKKKRKKKKWNEKLSLKNATWRKIVINDNLSIRNNFEFVFYQVKKSPQFVIDFKRNDCNDNDSNEEGTNNKPKVIARSIEWFAVQAMKPQWNLWQIDLRETKLIFFP